MSAQPQPPILDIAARRPHRADARRNFDAVLAAAREAFAAYGTNASLEDIARQANVGIGTLYRNFPTRQDLLEAVYAGEVEELCQAAQEVAELEPWEAFTAWLDRFAGYVPTKVALLQALNTDSEVFRACKGAMLASALPIFERAQQAGELRPDVTLDDVLRMISGVVASTYADDDQRRRVLNIALDGLRARKG
jgi:AcrR family transcriptional regulator